MGLDKFKKVKQVKIMNRRNPKRKQSTFRHRAAFALWNITPAKTPKPACDTSTARDSTTEWCAQIGTPASSRADNLDAARAEDK